MPVKEADGRIPAAKQSKSGTRYNQQTERRKQKDEQTAANRTQHGGIHKKPEPDAARKTGRTQC